ncbi:MAG: N-6 DNA methylase [Bacteroidales bacterium]
MTVAIPATLFFLSKNRDGNDGKRNRMDEILFIDAGKLGEMATRRLRVFSEEDIAKIADAYHQWRNTDGSYEDIPGFCKAARLEDVKENDYKLTPGIYVGSEAEEDDGIPFEEKMEGLKEQLKEQFEKSNELQERIMNNLNDL